MWQNKRGTDWWQQAIGLCTVPYPAVCRDGDNPPVDIGLYDREANYVVKIGDAPEELRPTEPGGGPGAYIFIGNAGTESSCDVHNPHYDFNDTIIPMGSSYFARLIERQMPKR